MAGWAIMLVFATDCVFFFFFFFFLQANVIVFQFAIEVVQPKQKPEKTMTLFKMNE